MSTKRVLFRLQRFHIASNYRRNSKLVQQLLAKGAQVNRKDAEGLTALDWAQRNGDRRFLGVPEGGARRRSRLTQRRGGATNNGVAVSYAYTGGGVTSMMRSGSTRNFDYNSSDQLTRRGVVGIGNETE